MKREQTYFSIIHSENRGTCQFSDLNLVLKQLFNVSLLLSTCFAVQLSLNMHINQIMPHFSYYIVKITWLLQL